MLETACAFWEMDASQYTLVLPNKHDIMNMNDDKKHLAHYVAKYFELHRSKKQVLLLVKPTVRRMEVLNDEKPLTKI